MAHSGINVIFLGHNFSRLLTGLWTTVQIAAIAIVIGLILGVLLGILRTFHNRFLRLILRLYLEFFRIIPTPVLLFLFYYILPKQINMQIPGQQIATLVFALWTAAEMSDIVRGALISVPKHQRESGLAIGLSRMQLYRYILIPQAFTLELPATINLITRIIKTTSLLMLISVMDVINIGQQIIEANNQHYPTGVFWVYGIIFLMYFLIDYPLSWWANRLERKNLDNTND
ncbi:amino acid ABC transporter permease [Companilactobacillus alimentarius]|uniref:Amino acid ABC transporter permease n=1 Tax=Companilactobacillus alimentarius DSM 20249 TaxID=1423720 RepID=A0A2K9HGL9_9LACO|nr:amino acid ABC transporter permease [Companilactobacillus alimentarius]AUI71669.1 amino acid ABC transporter permease [Companilactobacillus alimentarius DSM 20249]KRK78317.1 polar amino acid ABC transporter inner membrane subunit [Companilactobacillus alimentarius DSM 20249]GEO44589.1 amino acid ABC transporter permease [Companilactobacillus alimentarius]